MTFSLVTLYTDDLAAPVAFYRDVMGMQLVGQMDMPGGAGGMAFLSSPGASVQLEIIGGAQYAGKPMQGFSIGFAVEDIEAEAARLQAAGLQMTSAPQTVGGGTKLAFFTGPIGETIELIQQG